MKDREKLEGLISEIDVLVAHYATPSVPGFQVWYAEAERFLIKHFGENQFEHRKFKETRFFSAVWVTDSDVVKKCKDGLIATKLIFQKYLEEIDEDDNPISIPKQILNNNKIFIVHGHDEALKHSVARLVEKQGIDAVILSEQANQGNTIIGKFEEHSDFCGAICLFTADDTGKANRETNYQDRARQNVVLETGFFMGKLGRDRVVFIVSPGLEIPSDLSGVVYTDASNWQVDVLKELKAMGYSIDFNKAFD